MKKIKKGDNVTRNSYNNDIIFKVDKIIKKSNNINIAILKGIDIRIEADAQIEDLKLVSKNEKQNLDIEFKKKREKLLKKNAEIKEKMEKDEFENVLVELTKEK